MTVRYLPVLALMLPMSGFCGLEGFEFVDTQGSLVQLDSKVPGVNNTSPVKFIIASGLDRRLRVNLVDEDETILWSETTAVINTTDRVSYQGRDFYGKTLVSDRLTSDGSYRLEIETLNLSGEVVASESETFYRDTQSPVIHDSDFTWIRNGYSFGSIEQFANSHGTKELRINKVTDERSGLGHVDYFIVGKDGKKHTFPVMLNKQTPFEGNVTVPAATAANNSVAAEPGEYEIGVDVFDLLGNVSSFSRRSIIDNTCPTTPTIEVFNHSSEQWEPYVQNMMIYSNPVRVRWARDKSDFVNVKGWGWAEHQISYSDTTKNYREITIPIPQDYSYFHFYSFAGRSCYTYHYRNFKFTFSDGIDAAPKTKGIDVKTSVDGVWRSTSTTKYNVPYSVEMVRFKAEPRSYRQKAWASGVSTCYIEPGDSQCESTTSIAYSTGRGYSPKATYLSKDDGSLSIHTGHVLTYWDFNAPELTSFSFDESQSRMKAKTYDADTVSDWRSGMWSVTKVYAVAKADGKATTLNHVKHTKLDTNNSEWELDFNQLPDALYDVEIVAVDSYGNESTPASTQVLLDSTPPSIELSNRGGDLLTVSDILDLRVSVEDPNQPTLKSARLFGSSSNENVFLAAVLREDGTYGLEKPVIFPTLIEGETYSLEIVAEDRFANSATKTISFAYIPSNLIFMELQEYLAIDQSLLDSEDRPLAMVRSHTSLEIEGGMLASGLQEGLLNNRKNSSFSISAITADGAVVVAPGETKTIRVDLGEGEPLKMAIYPAEVVQGTAEIMFDIPQLSSKYN